MCGIAGIIGRTNEANRAALARMSAAIEHRGPDGEGTWESPADDRGHGVLLAHRRLSILDLSSAGAQPMVDEATGDVLSYNGEIYNFQDLRRELAEQGHKLASTGDTAVMLRTLALQGRAGIARLRGMFAFAHWARADETVTLGRDALGIKPLYIARNPDPDGDWSVIFSSEVRSLLASTLLGTPRLDPTAVASVVWNGFVTAPNTAVEGIETLWPGEHVTFDRSGAERVRGSHWIMPAADDVAGITEEELEEELGRSVETHLASDATLGLFLSGGVDSSAITNLAQQRRKERIQTFTLAFSEAEYDESTYADAVADAVGTDHRKVLLSEDAFVSGLDGALNCLDQPSFDGTNTYYMSHAVRNAGFKVALVGTGGDELFGGYTSFRDLPAMAAWARRTRMVPSAAKQAGAQLVAGMLQPARGAVPPQTRWAKLSDMVAQGDDLISLYQLAYALFLPGYQERLRGDDRVPILKDGLPPAMRARLAREIEGRGSLETVSVLEQRLFLGERLLRDTDATSMSASIEIRLPLVDQGLLAAVMRLRTDARYEPVRRKDMLRRIGLKGIDPAIFERPKSGFVLPYDRWMRSTLGDQIDRVLTDPDLVRPAGLDPETVATYWRGFRDGAKGQYWTRVWALYVLVQWCDRHGVRM